MNAAAALGGKRLAIHCGFTRAPHGQALKTTASGATRSFFESKFKPPKTPPSHGLTGFDAIKTVAKMAMVSGPWKWRNLLCGRVSGEFRIPARVRCGFSGFSADWVAQRPLSEPGPPGLASGKALKSRECAKAALKLSPVQAPFCSGFESKSKAPKTPPSHGLTGFAAIKPVAKAAMVSERGRQRNCFSGGCQAGS